MTGNLKDTRYQPISALFSDKRCEGYCGEVLPLSEFYNNRRSFDGKADVCKKCAKKCTQEWNKRHPEKSIEYNAKYRAKKKAAKERARLRAENKQV